MKSNMLRTKKKGQLYVVSGHRLVERIPLLKSYLKREMIYGYQFLVLVENQDL